MDLEVGAAPHLHHSEPDGSSQCDLDSRRAGTPCLFGSGLGLGLGRVAMSAGPRRESFLLLFLNVYISLESHYEQEAGFQPCAVTLELQGEPEIPSPSRESTFFSVLTDCPSRS